MSVIKRFASCVVAVVALSSSAYAVQFRLASVVGNKWTYTLTYDPSDNYRAPTTITLTGLSGVISATGPTSTDFPAGSLAAGTELAWSPSVQSGGTTVVWTQNSGGTGNYGSIQHSFGFSITATGAVTGSVPVVTHGFCLDNTPGCPSLDISTQVQGPVAPTTTSSSGSMAHVATAGGWGTLFTLVNNGTTAANTQLNFFGDNGNPLALPVAFPQQLPGAGAGIAPSSSLSQTINPGATLLIDSTGDPAQPQVTGWAQLLTSGKVDGFGIFKYPAFKWEAVVPLETRNASSYILAFDNTGAINTGVAISLLTQGGNVGLTIRDDTGAVLGNPSIPMPAQGHVAFLGQQYPATDGKRGTIEIFPPAGGQISVLGLRANGPALTTLPVLASGGVAGGSIAHVTFNGGFTSSFYIVNPGAASAQFTINYLAEDGTPLSVPMFLPQTRESITATSLTRSLAAGAMLLINTVSQDALVPVTGSAQLTTSGSISGFEIFQLTSSGQEASVPLETRTPASFVLAFDNTNGLTTGVAVAIQSAFSANITVKVNDDTGATLQTASIDNLPGHGHVSFLLPTQFPITANRRGTVEFAVPSIPISLTSPPTDGQPAASAARAQISVIGLRAKADGTLTTIPILAK